CGIATRHFNLAAPSPHSAEYRSNLRPNCEELNMATKSNHESMNALTLQSAELCDCKRQVIGVTHSLLTPGNLIANFFDLAVNELIGLRTRAEIEAIEQAAVLILECEA